MQARDFKNIIFDLGGVIINLDEKRTIRAFAQLSSLPEATIEKSILQFEAYQLFEKGLIPDDQFRNALREEFKLEAADDEIDRCMNAMLLDIPLERIELLQSLTDFSKLLLSNTNAIHFSCFNQIVYKLTGRKTIDPYFDRTYYSHKIHMRKPDRGIFELIIAENNLIPEETLFLDDNQINLEGAKSLGIKTFQVTNPSQLFELFP